MSTTKEERSQPKRALSLDDLVNHDEKDVKRRNANEQNGDAIESDAPILPDLVH